jgi:hypothetical protein
MGALRPPERLDAGGGRGRQAAGQAEGAAEGLLAGGREVPGAATRFDGGDTPHHAAPEPDGRPQRVHLDRAADRHAQRRCAELAERLLQLQGRDRRAAVSRAMASTCSGASRYSSGTWST